MAEKLQEFATRLVDRCTEYWGGSPPSDDDLFSVEGFAKLAGGLSRYTVESWLTKGKILRTKIGGRTMIRRSELNRIAEEGGKSKAPNRKAKQSVSPPVPAAQPGASSLPPRRGRGRPRKTAAAPGVADPRARADAVTAPSPLG